MSINKNENNPKEKDPNEEKHEKHTKYYVALLVCLAAVSAAGWSTYKTVKEFTTPQKSSSPRISRAKEKSEPAETNKSDILESNNEDTAESSKQNAIPYERKTEFKPSPASTGKETESEETKEVWAGKSENLAISYPAENIITKEYSDDTPIYSKTFQDWRAHEGTDFKAEKGSPVKSITSGVITDIYEDPSYGNTVVISHDGKFTAYYCGLEKNVPIKKGNKVISGEEIGTVDKVPCEVLEDSHLHLCISKDGKFIDPLLILDKENQ